MMKRIIIIAIAALFSFGQGAWAQEADPEHHFKEVKDEYGHTLEDGTEATPFLIKSIEDLNNLAEDIKNGVPKDEDGYPSGYSDTYFLLVNDLDYSEVEVDEDGSNFMPIGLEGDDPEVFYDDLPFSGIFDGGGKTITGITINKKDGFDIALFGYISGATIKNLTLANSTFIGNSAVGGIVGYTYNSKHWIVNCIVAENVTITGTGSDCYMVGGIVGCDQYGFLSNCSSAATVSGYDAVGGIAGNITKTVLTDCYYVADKNNVKGETDLVGVIVGEVDENEGGILKITLFDDDSEPIKNEKRIENYNGQTVQVTLKDRTLYKDGAWNTICLPFDIKTSGEIPFEGTPFKDATVMKFSESSFGENSSVEETGAEQTGSEETGDEKANTLTLNFTEANSIEAGIPYMVKWNGTDVSNPVFENVEIKKAEETESATTQESSVDFVGSFSPVTLTANDRSVLYMGATNKLYYPSSEVTIGSFRAYFKLNGITVDPNPTPEEPNSINNFVLNFGDDLTGISLINHRSSVTSDSWFTLDGRKLSGQPSAKGIYINHGHKVIIK